MSLDCFFTWSDVYDLLLRQKCVPCEGELQELLLRGLRMPVHIVHRKAPSDDSDLHWKHGSTAKEGRGARRVTDAHRQHPRAR